MGDEESWRGELEKMGFTVECSMSQAEEQSYFKGLAMYPECLDFFVDRLNRALTLFEYY
jgi:cobalamin biosynthesis Co2+ chelatase CbiK